MTTTPTNKTISNNSKNTIADTVTKIRQDFPILASMARGQPLVYLDNAATAQKPNQCITTLVDYYQHSNANVHRGVHALSERATAMYEAARQTVANFIHSPSSKSIVFTRGATESINLVAHGFAQQFLQAGDEIILTELEHHANIVPWQFACQQTGAKLKILPIDKQTGQLLLTKLPELISAKTKLIACNHISNAIGIINPIEQIIAQAKQHKIPVLIDGTQAAPHATINVAELDCDFYVFSGHKCFGPTGIGVLYAKPAWLEALPPYQGGGEMITEVSFSGSRFQAAPYKFEAGTPNIAGAIGLAASLDYLTALDFEQIIAYEQQLTDYAHELFATELPSFTIIGQSDKKIPVISFVHENIHPHDVATILDMDGIAVRAGHHCTMPLMTALKLPATTRASCCFYNTKSELDQLVTSLKKMEAMFQ